MSANGDYPPHSTDSELSVLGGLMRDNEKWYAVSGLVSEDDFYSPDHRAIWRGIAAMFGLGKPVDPTTLSDHLRDQGQLADLGGFSTIATIATDCPGTANIEEYAKRVRETSQRRKLADLCRSAAHAAGNGAEAVAVAAQLSAGLERILSSGAGTSKSFAQAIESAVTTIANNRVQQQAGGVIGAPTGLAALDAVIGGFTGPRLVVIGARPGTGKTALLNQFAVHAAGEGFGGLICSLEMGSDELATRAMASAAQVNVTRLTRGDDREKALGEAAGVTLGGLPLWIDTETSTIEGICSQIAVHKMRYGIQWAAVDHIGLIRTQQRFGSRNDQLGHISWELKSLAKRLNIPVIALSQLSRKGEDEGRLPREDDLRESGNIEQDADVIVMAHVPKDERGKLVKTVRLGVVKNRAGPKLWISANFQFDGPTQTFREIGGAQS